MDLYKRVMPEPDVELYRKDWEEVGRLLLETDTGFEINTSYSRMARNGTYPSKEVIKILIDQGVRKITIGSDAHTATSVGRGIEQAQNLLKSMGIKEIYRFEKREAIAIPL